MLVKMITTMSGPDISAQAGQEIKVSADRAGQLIAGGFAVPVKSTKIETATAIEIETDSPVEIETAAIDADRSNKRRGKK